MIVSIWKYRKFIWQNAWRDLWYRYAGSSIGFLWNVINPLFQILLFTLVFSQVMQVRIDNISSSFGFAIYLCSGLIPWINFYETVSRCTNSFLENANYLKKLPIPEQIFVAKNATSSFISLVISMILLVGICGLLGHFPALSWICLPLVLVLFQSFAFGLGLLLGVINTFFKDIGQALDLFLQLWFWATPIVYSEMILPASLKSLLLFNPVYYFIATLHDVIVDKGWPKWDYGLIMCALAISLPLMGYLALKKLRHEIRDVL